MSTRSPEPATPRTAATDLAAEVASDGWARAGFVSASTRDRLNALAAGVDLEPSSFLATPAHRHGRLAGEVSAEVLDALADFARKVLPDHRPVFGALTLKAAGGPAVPFHQDWTYTDERESRAVFLWCSLAEAGRPEGCLRIVPRSHRWSEGIRPSRRWSPELIGVEPTDALGDLTAQAIDVPAQPGEVIAFDPGLLHASWPNETDVDRPAVTLALIPCGQELIHFHEDQDGSLFGFRVDDDFFTRHDYGTRPRQQPDIEPWTTAVTASELQIASEPDRRRPVTEAERPRLFNDEADRQLATEGWAVTPLLEPHEVEQLTARYSELVPEDDRGLVIDVMRPDRDLYRRLAVAVNDVVLPALNRSFGAVQPGMATFVAKRPGVDSAMFLHEDGTFVDERRYRSATLWIPLSPVGPEYDNGGLRVVPRSHLLPTGWGAVGAPDLVRPYEDHLRQHLIAVSANAGDAVVYDTRLLHASAANTSATTRLAAVCSIAPLGADLVHVEVLGRRRRRLWAIDRDFFVEHHPHDPEIPARYRVLDEITDNTGPLRREDLAVIGSRPAPPPKVVVPADIASDGASVLRLQRVPHTSHDDLAIEVPDEASCDSAIVDYRGSGSVWVGPLDGLGPLVASLAEEVATGEARELAALAPGARLHASPRGAEGLTAWTLEGPAAGAGMTTGTDAAPLDIGDTFTTNQPTTIWNDGPGPLVLVWAPAPAKRPTGSAVGRAAGRDDRTATGRLASGTRRVLGRWREASIGRRS